MDVATGTPWSAPPPSPRAIPGVIDVWRADLATVADELRELLCARERARAARILSERNRTLWARSRGVLRALLGRYLDCDPRELRFELGPHGKPALGEIAPAMRSGEVERPAVGGLRFNLSHSDELMLVAVTAGREVGVDVEVARDPTRGAVDEPAIAARVLGSDQARRLEGLDGEQRTREFLRVWTVREAAVKCLGTGLASMPIADDAALAGVWTAELDVGPRAAAAVAVQGVEVYELRWWDTAPTLTP
jgi:4'-phosphopantetheinyl transferase